MSQETKRPIARWVIFLLVALAAVIPYLMKFELPELPAEVVDALYKEVEALPEGTPVLISFDFDPGAEAELDPMARAILRQCFRKKLRVINLSLYMPQAVPLMQGVIRDISKEYEGRVTKGTDYVVVGFSPAAQASINGMGEDFYSVFPRDMDDRPLKGMPVMKGISTLKDFGLVIDLAAGSLPDYWLVFGQSKHHFKMGLGCTAVMATDYYPYLQSKQLVGMIGGMSAGYRYEKLVGIPGPAGSAMRSLSVIHLLIVALVIVGNIVYFAQRRR